MSQNNYNYEDVVRNTSFGRALSSLRASNIDKFIMFDGNEKILSYQTKRQNKAIKNKEEFYKLIVDIFQSITTIGFTGYEIIEFILLAVDSDDFTEQDKIAIRKFIKRSITIYSSGQSLRKALNNNVRNNDTYMSIVSNTQKIGSVTTSGRGVKSDDVRNSSIFNTSNQHYSPRGFSYRKALNAVNINKSIKNPTKSRPNFTCILVTNPSINVGNQNSLELASFFNSMTNIEVANSYPYMNAKFILPGLNTKDGQLTNSSMSNFLFAASERKGSEYADIIAGGDVVVRNGKKNIQTNMSIFTTPQTVVNMDEFYGHTQNAPSTLSRKNSILDPTQPFLTIKGFSLNSAPTKGLMSYKSGKLSVTLHDRARMNDIAAFIKPDLLGAFGAEIELEYGWSNNARLEENPIGHFINSSRVKEKYSIVNSHFTIDNSGAVNIDLSIAMKGSDVFKNTTINLLASTKNLQESIAGHVNTISANRSTMINNDSQIPELKFISDNMINIVSRTKRIDDASLEAITSFKDMYSFINENTKKNINVAVREDNSQTFIALHESFSKDQVKIIVALLFGIEVKGDKKAFEIKTTQNAKNLRVLINEIISSIISLIDIFKRILVEDLREESIKKDLVESLIGGIGLSDSFFPRKFSKPCLVSNEEYVSFGSIVNSLVQTHILSKRQFEEIQIVYYTVNDYAGKASCLNIASLLVRKKFLKEIIETIIEKQSITTVESILSQVILNCIQKKDNIVYGLSDLYIKRTSAYKPTSLKGLTGKTGEKNQIDKKLKQIYGINGNITPIFKIPAISFNFDCLTNENDASILRISVYDENKDPYAFSSSILEKYYNREIKADLNKTIMSSRRDLRDQPDYVTSGRRRIKSLIEKGQSQQNKSANIKNKIKSIYPSLTFGTQNSAMLNASVTTINENMLSTIFIRNSERNDLSLINSRQYADLPTVIMPTQASVEIIGCPWVNFGQAVFLDFETGTTIDNKYVVTGITHNLTPGKFTTNLTLSYADTFVSFYNQQDPISRITNYPGRRRPKRRRLTGSKSKSNNPLNKKITVTIKDNAITKISSDELKQIEFDRIKDVKFREIKFENASAPTPPVTLIGEKIPGLLGYYKNNINEIVENNFKSFRKDLNIDAYEPENRYTKSTVLGNIKAESYADLNKYPALTESYASNLYALFLTANKIRQGFFIKFIKDSIFSHSFPKLKISVDNNYQNSICFVHKTDGSEIYILAKSLNFLDYLDFNFVDNDKKSFKLDFCKRAKGILQKFYSDVNDESFKVYEQNHTKYEIIQLNENRNTKTIYVNSSSKGIKDKVSYLGDEISNVNKLEILQKHIDNYSIGFNKLKYEFLDKFNTPKIEFYLEFTTDKITFVETNRSTINDPVEDKISGEIQRKITKTLYFEKFNFNSKANMKFSISDQKLNSFQDNSLIIDAVLMNHDDTFKDLVLKTNSRFDNQTLNVEVEFTTKEDLSNQSQDGLEFTEKIKPETIHFYVDFVFGGLSLEIDTNYQITEQQNKLTFRINLNEIFRNRSNLLKAFNFIEDSNQFYESDDQKSLEDSTSLSQDELDIANINLAPDSSAAKANLEKFKVVNPCKNIKSIKLDTSKIGVLSSKSPVMNGTASEFNGPLLTNNVLGSSIIIDDKTFVYNNIKYECIFNTKVADYAKKLYKDCWDLNSAHNKTRIEDYKEGIEKIVVGEIYKEGLVKSAIIKKIISEIKSRAKKDENYKKLFQTYLTYNNVKYLTSQMSATELNNFMSIFLNPDLVKSSLKQYEEFFKLGKVLRETHKLKNLKLWSSATNRYFYKDEYVTRIKGINGKDDIGFPYLGMNNEGTTTYLGVYGHVARMYIERILSKKPEFDNLVNQEVFLSFPANEVPINIGDSIGKRRLPSVYDENKNGDTILEGTGFFDYPNLVNPKGVPPSHYRVVASIINRSETTEIGAEKGVLSNSGPHGFLKENTKYAFCIGGNEGGNVGYRSHKNKKEEHAYSREYKKMFYELDGESRMTRDYEFTDVNSISNEAKHTVVYKKVKVLGRA